MIEEFNDKERVSKMWAEYTAGVEYQDQINLASTCRENINFYEGRQWATNRAIDIPTPVANVIKMIVRGKVSGVLASPVSLAYESSDNSDAALEFTNFARYIGKELRQEDLDYSAMLDGAIKGTYIMHYYWDAKARGLDGKVEGGMRGEIIDPLNIIFANPAERDEQEQEWIIIAKRMKVSEAVLLASDGVDEALITSDDKEQTYTEDTEQDNVEYCTVLTKYFRKDDEVYFERAVKGTILQEAISLTPNTDAVELTDHEINAVASSMQQQSTQSEEEYKARYYPIAVGNWDERNESVFGMSEVESLLPNQKIINFSLALHVLLVQNSGAGKYIVHPGALKEQKITNAPGQVLTDYSPMGNGIKRLVEPAVSTSIVQIADKFIEITRSMSGATEVASGEVGNNMSGQAIALLQQQANKPIQEMQRRYWRMCEKRGRVYEQFFKLYYDRKSYTYEGTDQSESGVFEGEKYKSISFSCVVSAGAGTQFSEVMEISMLDNLLGQKVIDAKTYIKLYPTSACPNKTQLIKAIEEQEQGTLSKLSEELKKAQQTLQQTNQAVEEKSKLFEQIDNVMAENSRLKATLLDRQASYDTDLAGVLAENSKYKQIISAAMGGGINAMSEMPVGAQASESRQGEETYEMQQQQMQ